MPILLVRGQRARNQEDRLFTSETRNFSRNDPLGLVVGALLIGPWLIGSRQMEDKRLRRIEDKIDLILNYLGLSYDPHTNVPADVLGAIRAGEKIEAIKRYRAATGADLAEAKERVEELQEQLSV